MPCDLNQHEKKILAAQFPDCKYTEERGDLIFAYQSSFKGDAYLTAHHLQSAVDFLKYTTCLNPTHFFNSRIKVGYTNQSTQCTWSGRRGNRIRIPHKSKYLEQDELLHSCAHELVHPFYRLSPLHLSNEKWGNPFCEFLRGPLRNVMGLDGKSWWLGNLAHKANGKDSNRNVAGQFLLYAYEKCGNEREEEVFVSKFINNKEGIKRFVADLFQEFSAKPMSTKFIAVPKMKING